MSKFTFGNFEAEFDPTDIHFVEKYEAAAERYQNKFKAISTEGKASDTMKTICEIFFETFDGIFGDGTSKQMFSETQSVDLCTKAFKQLIDMMNDYGETLKQLATTGTNRATKRGNKRVG